MGTLGRAEFGATTFCASSYPNDQCGANGLPLTPNSIKILGRFQKLRTIQHPRLCKYLELMRAKHERVIVVMEHYKNNLGLALKTGKYESTTHLTQLAFQILDGLAYLNKQGMVHRSLSPQNILFDSQGQVKLTQFGMYYMTNCGMDVSFPIGLPKYLGPEVLCKAPPVVDDYCVTVEQPSCGPKVDVWSTGLILMEAFLGTELWSTLSLQQIFHKVVNFAKPGGVATAYDAIAQDNSTVSSKLQTLPPDLQQLLRQCLLVSPTNRPTPADLLTEKIFTEHREQQVHVEYRNGISAFSVGGKCDHLELPDPDEDSLTDDHLSERSLEEVYYLWKLAGGDLDTLLKKDGLIRSKPPVATMSDFIMDDGEVFGEDRDRSVLLDDTVVILSQDTLRQRLKNVDETAYYPLLEDEQSVSNGGLPLSPSSVDLAETASLPLVIKEKDVEYQFHRVILYERLLKAYPYKRPHIWKEARVDIAPLVRPQVWAALLEVEGDVQSYYDAIDKETPTATDRQIEVDIPRCHQYNELLSSPDGHTKFKRILKAWVVSHPQYVYWQGLDSLCAPFLYLNFNHEALAYACLEAFIPKYLNKFFLKDNSPVIQEYLAVFSHLITFHDPELGNHLDGIGFIPDLYAIPWFLTMYAHVFPLHKIFHLWDTLLLGNSSFPLCIGVAILTQLRGQLLSYGFNECILLFSDMPEIDIEKCVQESVRIFCGTPKSATYRQHARPPRCHSNGSGGRPNVSYYSQEYHETPNSELSMEPVPLEELKTEKCPRISAEDLIELAELAGPANTRSPTKKTGKSKPKIIMLDVRSEEEYMRGTITGSINIPFGTAFSPEGDLVSCPAVQTLNNHRAQVKVVIGSRGKNATHFANELVRLAYSKVCVLQKGIDALRPTGLLTVPPPDI